MAYINQATKAQIKTNVDKILKANSLKGSLSIRNHSELVLTLRSGKIDFGGKQQVNHYYIDSSFDGQQAKVLKELRDALNGQNFNNSDIQSDYFDVGYYITLQIGEWNKPYQVVA